MKIERIPLEEGDWGATLTAYLQESAMDEFFSTIRPAIVICPGGGYTGITEKETEPVALKFISTGYHVFVLRYSIGAQIGRFPAPFIDVARSIKLIREHAKRWYVDEDKIALCGFSTGGHVSAILAATWQEDYLRRAVGEENHLFKPNALILGYPLLDLGSFKEKNFTKMQPLLEMMFVNLYGELNPQDEQLEEWNCIKRVNRDMPPIFLWTTREDAVVGVEQSLDFIKSLTIHQVPFEFHIFEKGSHGLSLGDETVGYSDEEIRKNVNVHKWVDLALNWLKNINKQEPMTKRP